MIRNIILTAIRNFLRNRMFSVINLIGLAISMSLAMLIIMIIREQFAFDDFHNDSERIYRVNTRVVHPEWGKRDFASAPLPLGEALRDGYAVVADVVRINRQLQTDAIYGHVNVPVYGLLADPSFITMFNFPLAKGDSATALAEPNSVVLTKQAAAKIFGTADPVGQTLSLATYGEFTVTGVLQELAGKTHFDFEMLCSFSTLPSLERQGIVSASLENWSAYTDTYVYLKLKEGEPVASAKQALGEINRKYGAGLRSAGQDIAYEFYLQPLDGITPGPELSGQMGKGMSSDILIFFGVLAGVVLIMSVFNFTNLTIAKSLTRAREIGIRKVVGAKRHQVFFQFIGEAVLFSMISLIASYGLLQVLKQGFLQLSLNEDFFVAFNEDLTLYLVFILFAAGVGVLAGALPAAYLSAFKPSKVLKDVQSLKIYARLTFRKVLIIAQFTLSVIFVTMALVIHRQIDFMITSDYGIEEENNLNLRLQGVAFHKIAQDIRSIPGVARVGGVSHKLGTGHDGAGNYKAGKTAESLQMRDFMVDDNYLENISLQFIAGRNFNADEQGAREKHVIVNETAASALGFQTPVDAVGQLIYANDTLALQVIGVVKDFHFRPMNNKIGPLALRYNIGDLRYLSAKIHPGQQASVMQSISTIWKKYDPAHPADLVMMEHEIDDAYRQAGMNDVVVMVGYITFLAILLACLGMLGMAMYASQVRAKEVGIRKVMGASVTGVVMVLSKSFMMLIGIALTIGVPVSYILGQLFLESFAYKTEISPMLIGLAMVIIAGLGMLIICSQTLKTALSNPVKWIRHE